MRSSRSLMARSEVPRFASAHAPVTGQVVVDTFLIALVYLDRSEA